MKKIVSNVLIVSTQLIIGGLFLFMLFSDSNEDNEIVVVENDNLNKMADAVSELFVADTTEVSKDDAVEVDLITEQQKKALEQAAAEKKAREEEEARIAAEKTKAEEEARIAAEKAKAEEEAKKNAIVVSANGYSSKPAAGFNVTTGNKTYSLSDSEFAVVATVVNCEAGRSRDDVLGVMSVILNRADRSGISPVSVVAAPYQFSCYTGAGTTVSESVASVMRDALYNGIRNNKYYSFGSWRSSVSSNYIANGGNRYY